VSALGVPRRCGQCPAAYAVGTVRLCPVLQRAGKPEGMHKRGLADDCIADRATLERFLALFAERRGLAGDPQ
jgi:hypothetical protein